VKLAAIVFPNAYPGAFPSFAPFTQFDSFGNVTGGFGPEYLMSSRSHSTFHALQAAVSKTSARAGIGFEASYQFAKSLDDATAVYGNFALASGVNQVAFPQNPRNPGAEKGPSTFDVRSVVTFNAVQVLPLERIGFLRPLGKRVTAGWQLLNITTLSGGAPFTVYSGIQQTGYGSLTTDRPDLVRAPVLSTDRRVREDYFGNGANNSAFFSIPLGVAGGTGPNQGRFGTLGRNTFRGPAFHQFDFSLIKDTPIGTRKNGEPAAIEFRAEFFNLFNVVNFGMPPNIVRGSGFGVINYTAGPSRQIQLSLKLIF
jgi:hypothetical protein